MTPAKPKKDEAPAEAEAEEEPEPEPEPEAEPAPDPGPPKPQPPKKLPKAVDVIYHGGSTIVHQSVDRNARGFDGNPVRYIFNPGVPIRVEIPYDIAKFCQMAWVSNTTDWTVRYADKEEEISPMEKIPYPPHPMEVQ